MSQIIVHSSHLEGGLSQRLQECCAVQASQIQSRGQYYALPCARYLGQETIEALSAQFQVDINIVPESLDASTIGLLITDMDSTLINIECVDEIADFAGKKAEVSAITEGAMRGELDFNDSLIRRVALLKGLNMSVLEDVYRHRLMLNPGAERLIQGLKQQNIKTALVSGGFTFFTDKLRDRLGFDYVLSNILDVNGENLTGKMRGNIVNADGKEQFLRDICNRSGLEVTQAIAMGDGANDLKMLKIAGMSVAYRAKPAVREQADIKINYSGLDSVLHILEYAKSAS